MVSVFTWCRIKTVFLHIYIVARVYFCKEFLNASVVRFIIASSGMVFQILMALGKKEYLNTCVLAYGSRNLFVWPLLGAVDGIK